MVWLVSLKKVHLMECAHYGASVPSIPLPQSVFECLIIQASHSSSQHQPNYWNASCYDPFFAECVNRKRIPSSKGIKLGFVSGQLSSKGMSVVYLNLQYITALTLAVLPKT